MSLVADRVKDSTATTGTGSITLANAPPSGFRSFATAFSANTQVCYCIQDQSAGPNWEIGFGTFNGTTGLTRDTVLASSNAGALVNFTSGACDVFVTYPAGWAQNSTLGMQYAASRGLLMP